MKLNCPNPDCRSTRIRKDGTYRRASDSRSIQRYKCSKCSKRFSASTNTLEYRQKKRRINHILLMLFSSGLSQNRLALILKVHRKTIARRLEYLTKYAETENSKLLQAHVGVQNCQFDELITIEHTKCKPLSVAMAVEADTRMILGHSVSQTSATGKLASISRAKYGPRKCHRKQGLMNLFKKIKPLLKDSALIVSDEYPTYNAAVLTTFSDMSINYEQYKGKHATVAGQGELKQRGFDPLFPINHTFAMLRANINRLIRRSWCTTKKPVNLNHHLSIYSFFHNQYLIQTRL